MYDVCINFYTMLSFNYLAIVICELWIKNSQKKKKQINKITSPSKMKLKTWKKKEKKRAAANLGAKATAN